MTEIDSTKDITDLKRYVYLGNEELCYVASKLLQPKQFIPSSLSCMGSSTDATVIASVLKEAAKDDLVDTAMLANTLALCVKSDKLRREAYSALSNVCLTSSSLFLFLKFLKDIAKQSNAGVWGNGCRKALAQWYANKTPQELVTLLITERQSYGWSHKDILKQIHFKAPSQLIDAIIKVFVFNKEDAIESLDEDLKIVASGLKELKTTTDPERAVYLLSQLKLTPNHVPRNFRESKKIWVEFVKMLPIPDLLLRLEFLTTNKALSTKLIPIVTSLLQDADGTKLDPTETYFALRRYEICASHARRMRAIEKTRTLGNVEGTSTATDTKKSKGKIGSVKACPTIVTAVQELLAKSIEALPVGNARWLMAINVEDGALSHLPAVTALCAAAITSSCIIRYAKSATFMSADGNLEQWTEPSPSRIVAKLRNLKTSHETPSIVLQAATTAKVEADVVVVISHRKTQCQNQLKAISESFIEYRNALNLPSSKLVVIFLKCSEDLHNEDCNTLVVRRFDSRVPRLIDAFARGVF